MKEARDMQGILRWIEPKKPLPADRQIFSGPLSSGLRAAGDVKFTMWASIFATVVCRTLLSFLLAKWMGMGVIGIALAMVLDWCIKAVLDIVRFRSGKWAENRII